MFETIDNVTMINESTGAFPDAAHRPARRWPGAVLQGQYPLCWTHCRQLAPLGTRPRGVCARGSALTCMTQHMQTNCQARKTFTTSSSPWWGSLWRGGGALRGGVGRG